MTASRVRISERGYIALSLVLLVMAIAIAGQLLPSAYGSSNNLRAANGECYRVSGSMPEGYSSAQDFYDADPSAAERSLLMQRTSCQEDMPGVASTD